MVTGNMCMFGMTQQDEQGMGFVKKSTGFMTNAWEIAGELSKKCSGDHRHITLLNGRAKRAEVYPDDLCVRIVDGLM